ncbi:transglutaminase-like putative cysteine protease [Algoriphagus ratkowskyi]|uniref:Transglutaminase family protein n=1 Tax=Algoriphagus ratkowskyi TaxID=57028 RepID=A0A2W7R431_9BACT|nr:transglutaminase family protein [Algoriphagus ratkowskyi]PZX53966.1 transglutaminase-like putative cysteine protease [Algoriphagus ratkowskyi]TXD76635.1 transglutaminase family protein [Algoriphagus ratkowskyi]
MKYKVTHITDYIYEFPATLCHNLMFQIPPNLPFQNVEEYTCEITPKPSSEIERIDFFGNKYLYFSVERPHKNLTINSKSLVELSAPPWIAIKPTETMVWEKVVELLHSTETSTDVRQYYLESNHVQFVDRIRAYTLKSFTPGRPIMEAMLDLNTRIFRDFAFTPGFTDISTPLEKVFKHKKGVCQDFAHFSLACLRVIGLSARYVSGYLETLPPPGKPKLIGADASHAWIAVYMPGHAWVEFDATNNLLVNDKHIRVAVGRDFADVTPLKGIVYSGSEQEMRVSVDVKKVEEE